MKLIDKFQISTVYRIQHVETTTTMIKKDDDDENCNFNNVDKIQKPTNNQSIDGILNAVAKTSQLSCICVLSEGVLEQLAEHVSQIC